MSTAEPAGIVQDAILASAAAYRRGAFEEAIAIIDTSAAGSRSPELNYLKGACAVAARRLAEAVGHFDEAISLKPGFADAILSKGIALNELGRHAEACASLEPLVTAANTDARAAFQHGFALQRLGRLHEALASYDAALRLRPGFADALARRGAVLQQLGQCDEALASYDAALQQAPGSAPLWSARGTVLEVIGRHEDALASYETAVLRDPQSAEAWCNRGNALTHLGRLEEALASYEHATGHQASSIDAWSNRGTVLQRLGRIGEALMCHDTALQLDPDCHAARLNRGVALLLKGDYARGFADYEARWLHARAQPKYIEGPWPPFEGQDLTGRTLVVHSEQGMGDILQFARYLPLLRGPDRRIIFAVPALMHGVLRRSLDGVELVAEFGPDERADFQCPLMSLPRLFGTTLETMPLWQPYLAADPQRVERWRDRIGDDGFRIGIAWQGKPSSAVERGRSIPLSAFAPLAAIPGVRLISLQKLHGLGQLAHLPGGMRVETLGEDFDGSGDAFVDTAGAMMSLDLVVAPDSAIAHLAGGLGRKLFLALKRVPDWRWLLTGERSPWYPSMRLFRQSRDGDWPELLGRIAVAVRHLVDRHGRDARRIIAEADR